MPHKTIKLRFFEKILQKSLVVQKKCVPLQSRLKERRDFLREVIDNIERAKEVKKKETDKVIRNE